MAQGYNAHSDILQRTVDGRDLNELWTEYQQVISAWNARRDALVSSLTYNVQFPIEDVPVVGQDANFERSSEYGEPKGMRPAPTVYHMGYDFEWYDLAARFTWQFLADATAQQVDAVQNAALEADSRLVTTEVLRTLFSNVNRDVSINRNPYKVYTFWNADGVVPPSYKTFTFTGSHTHFLTTGTTTLEASDVERMIDALDEHGYSVQEGYQQILLVNRAEMQVIRTWRSATGANVTPDATHATYDFIPTPLASQTFVIPQNVNVVGAQPPSTVNGFNVMGSYGPLLVVQEDFIPAGYLAAFATGGPANLRNPIGIREHARAELRGMRLAKGRNPDYPLIDSFYVRGFGTGVRHRGAGVVMQKTAGSYTAPTTFNLF